MHLDSASGTVPQPGRGGPCFPLFSPFLGSGAERRRSPARTIVPVQDEAFGHGELIRDIRRGRTPSWDRIRALCGVLGLEFYIGPVREPASVDDRRLELALDTAERGLKTSGQALSTADKARFVASIYDLIGKERSQASVARVLHLIEITSRAGRGRDGIDRVMHKARLEEGEE